MVRTLLAPTCVLVLWVAAASSAQAANYSIDGDPTTPQLDPLTAGRHILSVNGSPVITVPAGSFSDTWSFQLGDASLDVGVGGLNFIFQGIQFGTQISQLELKDGAGALVRGVETAGQLHFSNLEAGSYVLRISGVVENVSSGAYSGALEVAQLPLPGSLGLLASGLGLFACAACLSRRGDGRKLSGV